MPKAQRIAFISPRFAEGCTVGGAETLLRQLAERAAAQGRKVTFLATCAEDHFTWKNSLPAGSKQVGQFEVIRFPVDEDRNVERFLDVQNSICRHSTPVSEEEELAWIQNSVNSRALCDHLKSHGDEYDRIIAGPYLFGLTYFASQVHPAKTMLVPCLHDEAFAYLGIMRKMFAAVAGCLFNTEPERDLACRLFDLPSAKCAVVGMGFDAFDADPGAFAARHGINNPYVLYSGRRESGKGTPLLTDYMHTFLERTGRDLTLVFTGSGPIEAPDKLRPRIRDFGFVSESEKHEAMAGAAAFIHPSVFESLGIVLLESFLARTPALVQTRSAVLQWQCQRSGAGLWFRHYPEFEEELLLLLDNPELRRKMGEQGRNFVIREWSWKAVEKRLFAAIDQ